MKDENIERLRAEFPTVFRDLYGDPMATCMAWSIECGDGWLEIIRELCAVLEPKGVVAAQVKEKYGTLRFYTNGGDAEADAAIERAEAQSEVTCEICGDPGEMCGTGWLMVRCENCR